MPVLTPLPLPAPAAVPLDWAGIGSCPLPVAAGAPTALLAAHALVLTAAGPSKAGPPNAGPLHAEIDFVPHVCEPGTLLWLRPGQAVRFTSAGADRDSEQAVTITFRPGLFTLDELPGLAPDDPTGPAQAPVRLPEPGIFQITVEHLARDAAGPPGPATAALLRHELAALLLRIAMLDPGMPPPGHVESRTFERFRRRLEDGYPHTRRVEDYAAELGCSVRTLTRASLALTGRTAKQVVDDRVALQARRLLAATPLSVAEVGRGLGFGEPTNFGRFFHRETGLSPGQFRAGFPVDRPSGIPGQRPAMD